MADQRYVSHHLAMPAAFSSRLQYTKSSLLVYARRTTICDTTITIGVQDAAKVLVQSPGPWA